MSKGQVVAVIGRRRKASYGRISIQKSKKKGLAASTCTISENLAKNLRQRKGDKVKVAPLGLSANEEGDEEAAATHSVDMILLEAKSALVAVSLTLSPIEDSLNLLEALETGGDTIPDGEVMERFVSPYLESGGLLKRGQVLLLKDGSGRKLEFLVSGMELNGSKKKCCG